MKFAVVSSSADGWVDASIDSILRLFPIGSEHEADAVIVPVSYRENYQFNRRLLLMAKRAVLIDFTEYGWEAGTKPNLLGAGVIRNFGHLDSNEWGALDEWAKGANIILQFKRELMRRDASTALLPVEYLCRQSLPVLQSREEFEKRPIEVFSSWGLSNPVRQALHGDIFRHAHKNGIHVVDAWNQDQHFDGKTWDSKWPVDGKVWATIFCPHYNRKPMEQVMDWQRRAKLSVSLPGSGVKCFRSAEAPVGSIMALQDDDRAWAYEWKHGENCIRLKRGKEFASLLHSLKRADLFDIYRASQDTIRLYQPMPYVRDYLLPSIEARLSGAPAPVRRKARELTPSVQQFFHRGDLGDIIACLPAIRASGGGELLIGPHTGRPMEGREDLRGARFESIKPLLEIQPYIRGVKWSDELPASAIDFSTFRQNTIHGQSIAEHQARHIGVPISLEPWLTATPSPATAGRVVVANSGRYRHEAFPWTKLLRQYYPDALFVGTRAEHDNFRFRTSTRTEFLPTANLLELAEAIAGCRLFIGNQSCPFWIAAALGVPLIQEVWPTSPNSIIKRPNAQYWYHPPEDF